MADVADRLVRGLGVRQAQFNIEFFWDRGRDRIWVMRSTRVSATSSPTSTRTSTARTATTCSSISPSVAPRPSKRCRAYKFASSFVLRTFQGKTLTAVPTQGEVERFAAQYDDGRSASTAAKGARSKARCAPWEATATASSTSAPARSSTSSRLQRRSGKLPVSLRLIRSTRVKKGGPHAAEDGKSDYT